jgi:hypothetical protein
LERGADVVNREHLSARRAGGGELYREQIGQAIELFLTKS